MASKDILSWALSDVRDWVVATEPVQYGQDSNYLGLYREHLGLDDTHDQHVLDFGCGFGFDALCYARMANQVSIADIVAQNLLAAERVLEAFGYEPVNKVLVSSVPPFFGGLDLNISVFHASGVLHHTPHIREILLEAADTALLPGGEIRLMLYTNHLFRMMTGADPGPIDSDVTDHEMFRKYVRKCDAVGFYADWYSRERLEHRIGDFLKIESYDYLRPDNGNCVVRLMKVKT